MKPESKGGPGAQAPVLLDVNSTTGTGGKIDRIEQAGFSRNDRCPRRGMAYMRPNESTLYGVQTNCKSWSCKACRNRKIGQVVSLMVYGSSRLIQPLLVSLTFKTIGRGRVRRESLVSAKYAEAAFKEFIRRMRRRPWFGGMEWIRVIELTEAGQIHFHLIMGVPKIKRTDYRGGKKVRCIKHPNWSRFLASECRCIMHEFSREWYSVTKDSYIVDVRNVYDVEGACWYLAKYLAKTMYGDQRDLIIKKGYLRRYFCSSKWPRGAQMRRLGTVMKAWVGHGFSYGPPAQDLVDWSKDQPLMRQVGTNMAKELQDANMTRKRLKQMRRFKSETNVFTPLVDNRRVSRS